MVICYSIMRQVWEHELDFRRTSLLKKMSPGRKMGLLLLEVGTSRSLRKISYDKLVKINLI